MEKSKETNLVLTIAFLSSRQRRDLRHWLIPLSKLIKKDASHRRHDNINFISKITLAAYFLILTI